MKTLVRITSRTRTTFSHERGPLQNTLCRLTTTVGLRMALPLFFLGGVLLVQPCDATPFEWNFTGSLNEARDDHAATLLSNGNVLVAGGFGGIGQLESAELYDPATEIWTFTGGLNTARGRCPATLLADGRVLVAGGNGESGVLNSAELYDPATGTWAYTGSLANGRFLYTATLLRDRHGSVLVA